MAEETWDHLWRQIEDPAEVGRIFADYPGIWCVAGGWALDLFTGEQSRPHEDIDMVVARADLPLLHAAFPHWELVAAHGVLTPWEAGKPLPGGAHDIWCKGASGFFEAQFMVSEFTDTEWVFRRNDRIRGPRAEMIVTSGFGLPIMAPEIQLLYKSALTRRPKDDQDFAHTLPFLSAERRAWLASHLALLYGEHPWLMDLQDEAPSTA